MAGAVPIAAAPPPALAAVSATARSGPYEALRVPRAATQAEIKAAYRAMAKRLHPDASSHAMASDGASGAAAFVEIRRAYETLSDPAERARYDHSLGLGRTRWRPAGTMRVRRWETDQCW